MNGHDDLRITNQLLNNSHVAKGLMAILLFNGNFIQLIST